MQQVEVAHMEMKVFRWAVDRLLTGCEVNRLFRLIPASVRRIAQPAGRRQAAERIATVTVPPASLNRVSARLLFAQRAARCAATWSLISAAGAHRHVAFDQHGYGDKPAMAAPAVMAGNTNPSPALLLRLALLPPS